MPHVGVGGRGSGLLTPGVSDLCGSELSPENCKTLNKSLLTSHARGGQRTLTASERSFHFTDEEAEAQREEGLDEGL